MKAQANNASELSDIFQDLMNGYSLNYACAFLQACWFWPEDAAREECSLERLIYTQGEQSEIYTSYERDVINKFEQPVAFCNYRLSSMSKMMKCKTLALNIQDSTEPLKDSIALMKICNKAFAGFNVFLFVSDEGIFVGCSCIKGSTIGMDCVISPLITNRINWDALYDAFLFRNDSSDFYDYYSGIVGSILSIPDCYILSDHDDDFWGYDTAYDYDSDALEDYRRFNLSDMLEYHPNGDEEPDSIFDKEEFLDDVRYYMEELDFIVANAVNPLELLFEAQKAYEDSQSGDMVSEHISTTHSDALGEDDMNAFDMLDDPIALMQMLKKQRGI